MAENPTISIILPNFNGSKYLELAIKSFVNQDYTNKQLVIVDGKSTDGSHDIIRRYTESYPEIKWLNIFERGISEAFNNGIDVASGDIIGYLGSDDQLYSGVFKEISKASTWCAFDAIYFNSYSYFVNENRCVLRVCPDIEFTRENLLSFGTIVGWQNIFFKRHVYDKHRYDVNNRYCMDYEFYLRISIERFLYLYVDKVGTVNFFDGNISSDPDGRQFNEACEVAKKYAQGYSGNLYFQRSYHLKQRLYFIARRLQKLVNRLLNSFLLKSN